MIKKWVLIKTGHSMSKTLLNFIKQYVYSKKASQNYNTSLRLTTYVKIVI